MSQTDCTEINHQLIDISDLVRDAMIEQFMDKPDDLTNARLGGAEDKHLKSLQKMSVINESSNTLRPTIP